MTDASAYKQGRSLPGARIPVVDEAFLKRSKPDFIVVLPWNLREEIMSQLSYARGWGCRFVFAVPKLEID